MSTETPRTARWEERASRETNACSSNRPRLPTRSSACARCGYLCCPELALLGLVQLARDRAAIDATNAAGPAMENFPSEQEEGAAPQSGSYSTAIVVAPTL